MRRATAHPLGAVRIVRRRDPQPGHADGKGHRIGVAFAHGRHLATLGATPFARAKLIWAALWLPARRRLGRPYGRPIHLALAKDGRRIDVAVRDITELTTVGEVLADDLYDMPGLDDVQTVVDLGSHVGTSILFFSVRHPGAEIHGFEPDPRSFARLRANVGAVPGVTIDPRAASGTGGHATFHSAGNSLASSLIADAEPGRDLTVDCVTLDEIFDELGVDRIDLLKLDVEGAEYEVLTHTTRLGDVRAIAGELHPGLVPCTPDEFFALLEGFTIEVDEFSPASWQFKAVRVSP
jgi:FkbM family methyltransferase